MRKKIKKLSIVIPVYNEVNTISQQIKAVSSIPTPSFEKEIIIVDDGSTDGTVRTLKKENSDKNVKIIFKTPNSGKGSALKEGFKHTTGDIVLIQDADLEYSPSNYSALIKPIADGYADAVYGSRFINSNPHRVLYFYHYLANKLITTLSNIFTNLNLTDIETGYKVFRGDLIRKITPDLKSKRFGFEPEITARLSKIKGIRIYEVGISYFGRTYEEGKKIGWSDGVKAIFEIIRYNIFQ